MFQPPNIARFLSNPNIVSENSVKVYVSNVQQKESKMEAFTSESVSLAWAVTAVLMYLFCVYQVIRSTKETNKSYKKHKGGK